MPSDPVDRPHPAGRPRWWAAGLVLCLLLVAGGVLLTRRQPQVAGPPGADPAAAASAGAEQPSEDPADQRAPAASALLTRLAATLQHGPRPRLRDLAAPGDPRALQELVTIRRNVRRLGITDLSLREVGDRSGLPEPRSVRDRVVDVQLVWRLRGSGSAISRMRVALTLRQTGGRASFVTARRGAAGPAPLWLLGPVSVLRTARSTVVAADPSQAGRLSRLADRAVLDVRTVLPRWHGQLVVEVPRDQASLVRVLGARPGTYSEIAAVTTTADGSLSHDAPVHVFVNPGVFDRLGPEGSQIVISHEATHVATGGARSGLPTWLLEGFADYVALDHAGLSVSRAASEILAAVRRSGPPARLPGRTEFASDNQALGASYESAWLACRLLAREYGERRLIAFYRASDRASSTTAAFGDVLGTDQATFTRAWRANLRALARGR